MKFKTSHSVLSRLLLVSSVFLPPAIMAQEPVIDTTVNQSVQQVNSTAGTGLQNVTSSISTSNQHLQNIWNHMNADYKNKDVALAIINYEAAARMNEYNRNYELLFLPAPFTEFAVKAGETVGASTVSAKSMDLANKSLLGQVQSLTASDSISGRLGNAKETIPTRQELYNSTFKDFYERGNTNTLVTVNAGQFLLSDNLAEVADDAQSKQFIRFLTDPFPKGIPPEALAKETDGSLTAIGKEAITTALAQKAVLGVSASVLSDIIARRTPKPNAAPNTPGSESVMQVMNTHSKARFTDPEWYKEVGVASDTALLRELVHMQAYNSWVQYQQFKVQEQQTALLATMNAIMAKMNVAMDQLGTKLDEAAAQAKQAAEDARKQAQEMQDKMDEDAKAAEEAE